jgi:hypothetical protein
MMEHVPVNKDDTPYTDLIVTDCGQLKEPKAGGGEESVAAEVEEAGVSAEADVDEAEVELERLKETDTAGMTAREKRLFEIRLALNASRSANRKEAKEEHKRFNNKAEAGSAKAKKAEYEARKAKWQKELQESGDDPEKPFLYETAESVAYREDKQEKKKKHAAFGWDVFNADTQYNAYNKRLTKLPKKLNANAEENFKSVDDLDYAQGPRPSEEAIDRLVSEIEETHARREKFSRRRPYNPDADIDYINARNEVFNKKVKRAYDQYTAEIRANLERGTAL